MLATENWYSQSMTYSIRSFWYLLFATAAYGCGLMAQSVDTTSFDNELQFFGDFRFRFEEDWNSRQADGTYRADRFRMRYRFRYGLKKRLDQNFVVGARLRTGNLNDQQGPHISLGGSGGEFSTLSIGLEKAFLKFEKDHIWAWIGKNEYPFWKGHELLWNDNVFPDGLAVGGDWAIGKNASITPTSGYFVLRPGNDPLTSTGYLFSTQAQLNFKISDEASLSMNLGALHFNDIPNVPDGMHDMLLDYNILIGSIQYRFGALVVGADYYHNTVNYLDHEEINHDLAEEDTGYVGYLNYGKSDEKGDCLFGLYLAYIGKYSIVDYLSQNDWARWDYSGKGATGSRLSNFKGYEFRFAYQLTDSINAIARLFQVSELVTNNTPETGQRFRIDINAKF